MLRAYNSLHLLLAKVADKITIVTTNYDNLLEQAFAEAGKPYDLVVYPADNAEYANGVLWWPHGQPEPRKMKSSDIDVEDLRQTNVIYKMHGTVWKDSPVWDSFVITEEDYVRFLSRIKNAVPAAFRRHFSARSFLFLGYGLRDWNLRVLLKEVSVSERKSWAIMKAPTSLEKRLWAQRKVDLYDVDLVNFVDEMEKEIERNAR
ncbi:MAG: hypothetical protein DMG65_15320 [Candidatus Angelobacter sp. Gp1-AA117]|nr:MAG: hypothetical protein DMG65_15320 [Candidatus Angelobacter sp. Gp1-AA117]